MYEINYKTVQEELLLLDRDEDIMTIRLHRESTFKEVKETFNFIKKYYFKIKKIKDNDGLANIYENISYGYLPDTSENIKRDREWYWLKKEGQSYREIKKDYRISLRGIQLGIKRYEERLKLSI